MSHQIRIGLIGAARITPEAIIGPCRRRDDVRVVAVAARAVERAQAFADQHGVAEVEPTYDRLINRDDVDLIYVATPPALHAEHAIAALRAGKAVLCEKPFTTNAADARAMMEAARLADRPLLEALHYRFHDAMVELLARVSRGDIGVLESAEVIFNTRIPASDGELRWAPSLGGGALMDLGCYAVHALRTVCGSEPAVIDAEQEQLSGVDARTSARLAFDGGIRATLTCSMTAPTKSKTLTVSGSEGRICLSNFVTPHTGCTLTLEGRRGPLSRRVIERSTFDAQMDHIVDVLRNGAVPLTGGTDAIGNALAMDRITEAARH